MTAPKSIETSPPTEHPADTVDRVLHEQYAAWERGDQVPVETYRDRERLHEDPEAILDLICNEVLLRNRRQEPRTKQEYLAEYLKRFPELASQLPLHFEV